MKKVWMCLLLVFACLATCPSAWASWSGFVSAGSVTGVGNPSCAFASTGHAACALRSGKAAMTVSSFNGTAWAAWTVLAGTISSDPSCASNGTGKVVCAATATTGSLEVSIFNGTTWSASTNVTATLFSAPSCAELSAGQVLCAARNTTGGLAWTVYNGTTWKAFANLVTKAVSAPSCTTDNNGGVVCSVYTIGGSTLVNRFNGSAWQGFLNIGGIAGGEPDCTSLNSAGKVVCFAKAYTSGIYGSVFNGGAWAAASWPAYAPLAGTVNDNASCTSQAADNLVCGVIAVTDAAFYSNVFNGTAWTNWVKVGGSGVGTPACAPLGTGKVVCLIMGPANKLTSVVGP
jgi:serine protease AprX